MIGFKPPTADRRDQSTLVSFRLANQRGTTNSSVQSACSVSVVFPLEARRTVEFPRKLIANLSNPANDGRMIRTRRIVRGQHYAIATQLLGAIQGAVGACDN